MPRSLPWASRSDEGDGLGLARLATVAAGDDEDKEEKKKRAKDEIDKMKAEVRQWHRRFAKKKAKESELERAQIAREQQQSISARMEKSFVSLASAFTTFDDAGRKEQESFDRSPPEEQARREGPSSGRGLLL